MSAETIVVHLTPPGKSAIACLGVAGPRAWDAVCAHFRRDKDRPIPDSPTPRQTMFGRFGDSTSGSDEVIVFVRLSEPIPIIEIHCHGGPEVVKLIESLLARHDIHASPVSQWFAVLHDAERAEMIDVLTHCTTVRTAAIALDQLQGAFERAVGEPSVKWSRLAELIPVGDHLVAPWKVAVAGAPNIGKSSLVNALVGYSRCVVSPTPGTTRDIVTTAIALDGWPIELIDTAGLRDAIEPLEAAGIARATEAHQDADRILWVVDASTPPGDLPRPSESNIAVINKIDRAAAWDLDTLPAAIRVSASTGQGVDALAAEMVRRLVPRPPFTGEAVPITTLQRANVVSQSQKSSQ